MPGVVRGVDCALGARDLDSPRSRRKHWLLRTCQVITMRAISLSVAAAFVLAQAALPSAARAEIDLAGEWAIRVHEDQTERGPGPEIGDFTGLPINEAARNRGMSWDASLLTVPEHQCGAHPANYGAMH